MKPEEMSEEAYKRYQSDGFTEEEIQEIWQHTLYFRRKMVENQGKEPRDVTCSTYERAQKRSKEEFDVWFGMKK